MRSSRLKEVVGCGIVDLMADAYEEGKLECVKACATGEHCCCSVASVGFAGCASGVSASEFNNTP